MKPDIVVTPQVVAKHGITPAEYEQIRGVLGRDPNITELGIFSVMWSEHCSYKNSRPELKKFPREAPFILVKAGEENAGIVDIGDGWAIAFKIESHNHPSASSPSRGPPPGWAGSSATSSPWARGRCWGWTRCGLARSTAGPGKPSPRGVRTIAACWAAWWPASPFTAIASASRRWWRSLFR